jgi:hypothetical protein
MAWRKEVARYLSSLAFNGIYRVNKNGVFNVPYGGREYLNLDSDGLLSRYAKALASADIVSGDFENALASATHGDVVYLDPPYTVAHSNNGFVKYNARIFSWALLRSSDPKGVAEEAAFAYKDIASVMAASASLVRPTNRLTPLGVVKG